MQGESDLEPLPPVIRRDAIAARRINALVAGIAALVLLCLIALVAAMWASSRQAQAIAQERERAELANALAIKLDDMRTNLTSITFWDQAVEKTAIAYDRSWAEENVGAWLADFYAVDRSFLFDSADRLVLASHRGKTVPGSALGPYRPVIAAMIRRVREKTRRYRPGGKFEGETADQRTRRLDEARLVVVDGRPVYIVAAAILPDFGRLSRRPGTPFLVVAVHDFGAGLTARLGRSVLLDHVRIVPASAPLLSGEDRFTLDRSLRGPGIDVRWISNQKEYDQLTPFLPIVLQSMVAVLLAGGLGLSFVRRTARQLYDSRIEATHDALSGLPNRRMMTERLDREIAAGTRLALMFIDLDGFKGVNDCFGHAAGDEVIRVAARRLAAVPGPAQVARLGGDEFVVLVEQRAQPATVAREILAALRLPYAIAGTAVTLAGSIGIACAPEHAATTSELMHRADLALYRAKQLGKDRAALFEESMSEKQPLAEQLRAQLAELQILTAA